MKKIGGSWKVVYANTTYGSFISQDTAFIFAELITERLRKDCI